MDFFTRQRNHRQRSAMLYLIFFLVIVLHFCVGIVILELVSYLIKGKHKALSWLDVVLVALGVIGVFGYGIVTEWKRLQSGGRGIAKRLGAKRLFVDSSDIAWYQGVGEVIHGTDHEPLYKITNDSVIAGTEQNLPKNYRRFYEFAQQMSLASGMVMPALFVMPTEQGINGFIIGSHPNDTVLVLTQGAIDKLSDEALYGLIAHEYSYVIHGDGAFNLKLAVILAGLQSLDTWVSGDYRKQQYVSNHADPNWFAIAHPDTHSMASIKTESGFNPAMATYDKPQWITHWQHQNRIHKQLSQRHRRFELAKGNTQAIIVIGLVRILSGSSIFFAKLIKRGFARQRKFLADVTSLQLTCSHAVVQTLREIQADGIGSALTSAGTASFSYLFFAPVDGNNNYKLSDHPSPSERIQAIDHGLYQKFAQTIANQININKATISDIQEKKHQGTWQQLVAHSNVEREPYEFVPDIEHIVDGKLDVSEFRAEVARLKGWDQLLLPLGAPALLPQSNLPNLPKNLSQPLTAEMLTGFKLPWVIQESIQKPLKNLALIESIMLCHQHSVIDRLATFDLANIWLGIAVPTNNKSSNKDSLPHVLDKQLLAEVAKLDRRLDELILTKALRALSQFGQIHDHQLPKLTDEQRQTLVTYLTGLGNLVTVSPTKFANTSMTYDISHLPTDHIPQLVAQSWPNQSLWQAIQLYRLAKILQQTLNSNANELSEHTLKRLSPVYHSQNPLQLDGFWPSYINNHQLSEKHQAIILLFSLVLIEQISDYSRIDLKKLGESELHNHIVPLAHSLSRQIRLYEFGVSVDECARLLLWLTQRQTKDFSQRVFQPLSTLGLMMQFLSMPNNARRLILSGVHTLMLQDGKLSQNEYDSLLGLGEIWLNKREIAD